MCIPFLRFKKHTPTLFQATEIFREFLGREMRGVSVKAKPCICANIIGCT